MTEVWSTSKPGTTPTFFLMNLTIHFLKSFWQKNFIFIPFLYLWNFLHINTIPLPSIGKLWSFQDYYPTMNFCSFFYDQTQKITYNPFTNSTSHLLQLVTGLCISSPSSDVPSPLLKSKFYVPSLPSESGKLQTVMKSWSMITINASEERVTKPPHSHLPFYKSSMSFSLTPSLQILCNVYYSSWSPQLYSTSLQIYFTEQLLQKTSIFSHEL